MLSKRYAVGCESSDLLMRRVLMGMANNEDYAAELKRTRDARSATVYGCKYYGPEQATARAARASAKAAGWVRYSESFPLYAGAGDSDHTKITLDICPDCAPKVIPDHVPA